MRGRPQTGYESLLGSPEGGRQVAQGGHRRHFAEVRDSGQCASPEWTPLDAGSLCISPRKGACPEVQDGPDSGLTENMDACIGKVLVQPSAGVAQLLREIGVSAYAGMIPWQHGDMPAKQGRCPPQVGAREPPGAGTLLGIGGPRMKAEEAEAMRGGCKPAVPGRAGTAAAGWPRCSCFRIAGVLSGTGTGGFEPGNSARHGFPTIRGRPYFWKKSLRASRRSVWPLMPCRTASIRNCRWTAGSTWAVTTRHPRRLAGVGRGRSGKGGVVGQCDPAHGVGDGRWSFLGHVRMIRLAGDGWQANGAGRGSCRWPCPRGRAQVAP